MKHYKGWKDSVASSQFFDYIQKLLGSLNLGLSFKIFGSHGSLIDQTARQLTRIESGSLYLYVATRPIRKLSLLFIIAVFQQYKMPITSLTHELAFQLGLRHMSVSFLQISSLVFIYTMYLRGMFGPLDSKRNSSCGYRIRVGEFRSN